MSRTWWHVPFHPVASRSNRLRDGLLHPLVLAERDRVAGLGDRATRVEQQWLEKYFGWWLETGEDFPE